MPDSIKDTLSYAISTQLLVLYAIVFVGLALYDWNVFAPFYGLLMSVFPPLARFLHSVFGLLTGLVGFLIALVGLVGILKTVIDDAVAGDAIDADRPTEAEQAADD